MKRLEVFYLNRSDGETQKLLRDMRALINDFAKNKSSFPSIPEFEERLGIKKVTVIKYKKIIMDEDRKSLLEIFGNQRVTNVEATIKVMKENIKLYEKIRDGEGTVSERMQAAENIEKSHLSIAQVMYDAPEYLYRDDDNDSTTQEYSNRQEETKSEGIKPITD